MPWWARFAFVGAVTARMAIIAGGASATEPVKIGLAIANLRAGIFNDLRRSVASAAEITGATLIILDANDDDTIQARQVRDLTERGTRALIYVPAGARASGVPVKIAKAAGIPVVAVDRNPVDAPGDTFIGIDSVVAARVLGVYACQVTGGMGEMAVIVGRSHTAHEDDRDRGFAEAVTGCPGMTEADRDYSTRGTANEARFEAGRMLARDPEIGLIFAHSDALALGAALAVREAYVGHKVFVLGFDGDAEGLQAVDEGLLDATMTQPTRLMGRMALRAAVDLAKGEAVPAEQIVAAVLTTKGNVAGLIADHP